jgi:hypothetical protein
MHWILLDFVAFITKNKHKYHLWRCRYDPEVSNTKINASLYSFIEMILNTNENVAVKQ